MKRLRLQKLAKLLVLMQLVLGLAPVGVNLCIAEDGHTALEFSHATLPCLRDLERHHPGEAVIDAHELAHHACEDVPLLEDRPYRTSTTVKLGSPPIVTGPVPLLAAPVASRAPVYGALASHPPPGTAARALRTIVLLV